MLARGAVRFGGSASLRAVQSPRYLTGGYYYKRQEQKQIQNCWYATIYKVIRTYFTSHPIFSTRQV